MYLGPVRILSAVVVVALCGPAIGEGNTLRLVQETDSGRPGNELFIDQSEASGSLLAGSLDGTEPARQQGGGNLAEVTLTGVGAIVALNQMNDAAPFGHDDFNRAFLSGGTLAAIVLDQQGTANFGTISVGPGQNAASLTQIGTGNDGAVLVDGTGSRAALVQRGNGNAYRMEVSGAGTDASYTQIGNGLGTGGPALQVFSNGAQVSITQSRVSIRN